MDFSQIHVRNTLLLMRRGEEAEEEEQQYRWRR